MIVQISKYFTRSLIPGLLLALGTFSSLSASIWQQPPTQFASYGISFGTGATDGNGNALAIWTNTTDSQILSSYYNNGAWGPDQIIGNDSAFSGLNIAMDATGTGLALWIEDNLKNVMAAHFSGGVWTTPTIIDTISSGTRITVSMDGSGNGLGIWTDPASSQIRYSFYTAGTNSWGAATVLGIGTGRATVSYSPTGTAVAAWLDGTFIRASLYNGITWVGPFTLGNGANNMVTGNDAVGNPIIAWIDLSGNVVVSQIIGIPVTFPGPGNVGVSLGVAPGGTAVLIWTDSAQNGQYSTFNGSTWAAPIQFGANITYSPFGTRTSVSLDSLGNALILYGTDDSEIFSIQIPVGGIAGSPLFVTDDINGENATVSSLTSALSSGGIGFAFWRPSSEGPMPYASVLLPSVSPPGNLIASICKNKFASQTDLVYILTWTPSTDPATAAYYLRRNGVLIGVIPARGPFIYYDHNRNKHTTAVYTLTAVTSDGVESTPISVKVK